MTIRDQHRDTEHSAALGQRILAVGQRIELQRRRQRISRRAVAELVGRSEEWLRLVEKGRLRLDSVSTIVRLAEVLRIQDYRDLIELPDTRSRVLASPDQDILSAWVPALFDHPEVDAFTSRNACLIEQSDDAWLADEVARCNTVWAESADRYAKLGQYLPRLLTASRARLWNDPSGGTREVLIGLLHLARKFLTQLNAHDLAALAALR